LEGLLLAVAAVIVTFNSVNVIHSCLEAVSKMMPEAKAIVVDNGSEDGTVEHVRTRSGIQLIANPINRGFAAAVNQGVRASEGAELVLLLNPDVQLLTAVDDLEEASHRYGLAAGKLVGADGRPQAGFTVRRFPTPVSLIFELFGLNRIWASNPVNRRYRDLDRNLEQPGPVEQPAGAFLMVRRDVWERLGGLDEQFHPVWFEDVDFCRRAVEAGYRIEYVPSVAASHQGGHSVARVPAGCRAIYWCVSLLKYAGKHFRPVAFRGVCGAVVLSSVPRMVAGMITERSLAPLLTYLKIMWFAGSCLVFPGRVRNVAGIIS
jgi:GT2 family glycosyltransferase